MKQLPRLLLFSSAFTLLAGPVHAADISATGTGALNAGTSWVGGTAPGTGDVAVFDSNTTITGQPQVIFGANLAWGGIIVTNPVKGATSTTNGLMIGTSSSGNTSVANLTLGNSSLTNGGGIDMSNATTPFYIGANLTLAASQTWNVAEANSSITTPATGTGSAISPFALTQYESLVVSGASASSNTSLMPFSLGGNTLTTTGLGGIVLYSGLDISNGTINVGNGAQGVTSAFNDTQAFVIQSGGAHPITVESNVTIGVTDATMRIQVNSGSVFYNATTNLNDNAVLNLISTNSGAGNSMTINGPLNILGNTIIADTNAPNNGAAQSRPITIAGNLTGSAALQFQVVTTGTGSVILNGNDSAYTGAVTLDAPSGNGTVTLGTATAGSAAATWTINAANTLRVAGVTVQLGTLNGAGQVTNSVPATTAQLVVGSGNFSGNITNGAANIGLTKVGAGTLLLTGNDTLAGPNIDGGTLINNGVVTVDNILVNSGATLAGNGTINGNVIINSGGIFAPGNQTAIGALTIGNNSVFTWNGAGGDTAYFALGNSDSTSDQLNITGTGVLSEGSGSTFQFNFGGTGN
ncbi:MAG: hypothetical protein ABSH19_03095, partial [Opitutales bacterium]